MIYKESQHESGKQCWRELLQFESLIKVINEEKCEDDILKALFKKNEFYLF